MNLDDTIRERLRHLPPERKRRVLAFVESLLHDSRDSDDGDARRSPLGLWSDMGFSVSAEDIDEARREMWGNFPREDV